MTGENSPRAGNEGIEPTPLNELIALHFEKEALGWLTSPEEYHPLSGAIEGGHMGTREQRVTAVTDDSKEVADYLMEFASTIRKGEQLDIAFKRLQMSARFDEEAYNLMKAIDPEAKPWYPDGDVNGDRVIVGKRYRYYPDNDNQGNEPGFVVEGVVTKIEHSAVYAHWERVGTPNVYYWGGWPHLMTDEEYLDKILKDAKDAINDEINPRETFYFANMLHPVEPENSQVFTGAG